MGWLSTKKKTVVTTSVVRMIEDKDIPDVGKVALYDYMFHDKNNRNNTINTDRSLTDFIALGNANSIGTKLRQSRAWAKKNYAYGVPEGNVINANQVDLINVMDEYLSTKLGEDVRIGYSVMAPLNSLHFAWYLLEKNHSYNLDTNIFEGLSIEKGVPVYLKDIQINYCSNTIANLGDPETIAQRGTPATFGKTDKRTEDRKRAQTLYVEDKTATHDYALITYSYMAVGVEVTGSFKIDYLDYEYSGNPPTEGLDDDSANDIDPDAVAPFIQDTRVEKDFFMVEYFTKEGLKDKRHYFVYEYKSGGDSELDHVYTTNKKLGTYYPNMYFRLYGSKLSADVYKDTNEYKSSVMYGQKLTLDWKSLNDKVHESVGSLDKVTQIVMSCQMQMNTDDPLIKKYLYEYFYTLYNQLPRQFNKSYYDNINESYVNGFAKVGQSIEIADKAYSNQIAFSSIGYVDVIGSIGDKGTVTLEYKPKVAFKKGAGILSIKNFTSTTHIHILRKQITATTYRELTIYSLSSTQRITGGHSASAVGQSEELILPLDEATVSKFSMKDRSLLYSKSLVFIFNTIDVVKTKWYQRGAFKAIMFVVAVIISVYTGGQGMTLYALLYAAGQTLVVGLVLNLAIKFLVEKLDMNIGGLFAVVAIVLIIAGGAAMLSDVGSIMGMNSAQFMQLANYSIQISGASNQLQLGKMVKAQAEYYELLQDKYELLEAAQADLKGNPLLNPAYLLSDSIRGPDIRVGESMNSFLVRTLSVDTGLATLDTIPNMVALTVRLPSFEELYSKYANTRAINYG